MGHHSPCIATLFFCSDGDIDADVGTMTQSSEEENTEYVCHSNTYNQINTHIPAAETQALSLSHTVDREEKGLDLPLTQTMMAKGM